MKRAEQTRLKIERTALRLFAEKGVDQTTTKDLALGAEIAEGTIYRHFESKEALIRHMFQAHYLPLGEELDRLQSGQVGVRAKLSVMCARFCELFDSDPDLYRFLFFVQHGQVEKLPSEATTAVTVIGAVLNEAMERAEIPQRDQALVSAWLLGVVTQTAVFHIYGRLSGPLSDHAAEISDACWRLISA
jgi:AcrR family transcriptional regulator